MRLGDRHGEIHLLTGHARPLTLTARAPATIATLDRARPRRHPGRVPRGRPAARRRVSPRSSARRTTSSVRCSSSTPTASRASSSRRPSTSSAHAARRARRARVARSARALFRRLVVRDGRRASVLDARGLPRVARRARASSWRSILKYGLEKRLFALVPGNDPNPMHVHHFNYGLIAGRRRRASRRSFRSAAARCASLAFAFGLGVRPHLRRVRALLEPEPRVRAEPQPHLGGDRRRRAGAAHLLPPLLGRARPALAAPKLRGAR